VDLFKEDGWTRLVKAIQIGMERRADVPVGEEPSPITAIATPSEGTSTKEQGIMAVAFLRLKGHNILYRITEPVTVIGRAKKCHLEIPKNCDNVERCHTTIFYKESIFIIADGYENSSTRFGTFVNGVKVEPQAKVPLRHGDRIVLGGFRRKETDELSRGACEIIFERRS
jgi:hypothetical protein